MLTASPVHLRQGTRLSAGEDVFLALDGVLERLSDLQQLVSSWSKELSEDDTRRGCSSSCSSSSPHDSPAPCPSSPSHIHLEVQLPGEEEEKQEMTVDGEQPQR